MNDHGHVTVGPPSDAIQSTAPLTILYHIQLKRQLNPTTNKLRLSNLTQQKFILIQNVAVTYMVHVSACT